MAEITVPIRIRKTAKERLERISRKTRRSMVETLDILLEAAEKEDFTHD